MDFWDISVELFFTFIQDLNKPREEKELVKHSHVINIIDLPTEVLRNILKFLSYSDLIIAQNVCQRFHDVIQSTQWLHNVEDTRCNSNFKRFHIDVATSHQPLNTNTINTTVKTSKDLKLKDTTNYLSSVQETANTKDKCQEESEGATAGTATAAEKLKFRRNNNILDLNLESICHIFKYLSPKDLCNVIRAYQQSIRNDNSIVPFQPNQEEQQQQLQQDRTTFLKESEMAEYVRNPTTLRPFFQNVISLQVSGATEETSDESDSARSNLKDLLDTLKDHCSRLTGLYLQAFNSGSESCSNDFPDTLRTLHLTDLEFNNAYNLFKLQNGAIINRLTEFEMCGFSNVGLDGNLLNLQALHLQSLESLSDRGFLLLNGNLSNLKELDLSSLTIGNETFEMIGRNFPNLTKLNVFNCKMSDRGLVTLDTHYNLEELVIQSVALTDTSFKHVIPSLKNLKVLKILYCNIGNETMMAIGKNLTNLSTLEIYPNDGELVTDEGFQDFAPNPYLNHLSLDYVQITDCGLHNLTSWMPSLARLRISSANIGDEALLEIATLARDLVALDLRGTHVTDVGLIEISKQLEKLEELQIDSGSITEAGLRQTISKLSQNIKSINIDICDSTKRITYYCDTSAQLSLTVNDMELTQYALQRFRDVQTLTLCSDLLSADILTDIGQFQPQVTNLYLTGCKVDDEALTTISKTLLTLERLSVYQSIATGIGVSKLLDSLEKLQDITIEIKEFLDRQTILHVAPKLKRLKSWDLHDSRERNNSQIMSVTYEQLTEVRLSGEEIDDDILNELVKNHESIEKLYLRDTIITDNGIERIATSLSNLKVFLVHSEKIGNETLRFVGSNFQNIKELLIKSPKVTDDGFEFLSDDQLSGLEVLEILESNITDLGIRKIAPKLKAINSLNVFENPNVNEGIRDFLHQLFPQLGLVQPEQTDNNEEPIERNEE